MNLKNQIEEIISDIKENEDYFDIYEAIRQDIRERGDECTEDEVNREADNTLSDFLVFVHKKFKKYSKK